MKKYFFLFLTGLLVIFLSCQKELSYELGNNTLSETSWQFKDSASLHNGTAISYSLSSSSLVMSYDGGTTDGRGSFSISIRSLLSSSYDSIRKGTYQSINGEVDFSYSYDGVAKYVSNANDTLLDNITVSILSIDSVSVIGFFSGTAIDSTGKIVPITEGKFNYRKAPDTTSTTVQSKGTLGTVGDSCTGVTLEGNYYQSASFTAENKMDVSVNITKTGNYTILTDTVNGVYFSKTGSFSSLGNQTVTLAGSGTPADSGTFKYKIKYDSSVCNFSIHFVKLEQSSGSLGQSLGNCTDVQFAGTYEAGTTLTDANTITIEVNITSTGLYSISTDTVNGFYFNKTGAFSTTGLQTVALNGYGTPQQAENSFFTLKYDTSICKFITTVDEKPIPPPPTNTDFQFTEGSTTIVAAVDDAVILNNSGFESFALAASSGGTPDTAYTISITSASALSTGTDYKTSSTNSPTASFHADTDVAIYKADVTTAGVSLTIKFTTLDRTTKKVVGTFSGTVKDGNGATKTITNGKFSGTLN